MPLTAIEKWMNNEQWTVNAINHLKIIQNTNAHSIEAQTIWSIYWYRIHHSGQGHVSLLYFSLTNWEFNSRKRFMLFSFHFISYRIITECELRTETRHPYIYWILNVLFYLPEQWSYLYWVFVLIRRFCSILIMSCNFLTLRTKTTTSKAHTYSQ